MEMDKKRLVIAERKISVYRIALSIVLSLVTATLFGYFLYEWCQVGMEDINEKYYYNGARISSFLIIASLSLSFNRTVMIDLEKEKLNVEYSLVGIKYSFYKQIPKLEYISVFKNSNGIFEVNLWYVGNKHYTIYEFEEIEKDIAFSLANQVSNKLNLDLLDATEKGNFKWIDKNIS